MQTKDEEEKAELEDDLDYSDEETEHQVRSLSLRKGQFESHTESSGIEAEAEMETEVQLVATTLTGNKRER